MFSIPHSLGPGSQDFLDTISGLEIEHRCDIDIEGLEAPDDYLPHKTTHTTFALLLYNAFCEINHDGAFLSGTSYLPLTKAR